MQRYRREGEAGLLDRASAPHRRPTALHPDLVAEIDQLRRSRKWSARLIAVELTDRGHPVSAATVGRWLVRIGLNRRRWLDVDGEPLRQPGRITARYRGHMVHLDVKKVGRIPDGGGWRVHGRGSDQHRAVDRAKVAGARAGYVYLHSAVDGFSRLAYPNTCPTRPPRPQSPSGPAPGCSSLHTASPASPESSPTTARVTGPKHSPEPLAMPAGTS